MIKAKLHHAKKRLEKQNDIIMIVGDGRTAPKDISIVKEVWKSDCDVGCIGRAIKLVPQSKHWFNVDGDTAIYWASQINGAVTHTIGDVRNFDTDWDVIQPDYNYAKITGQEGRMHGSTALFAVLVSIEIGYKKIILAGCPLDTEGHWYWEPDTPETLGPIWQCTDIMAWIDFKEQQEAKNVKSMSGYTAKILGKAKERWLNG